MNAQDKQQETPNLILDYDSESDHSSGQEQTSPVFVTSNEQSKKKLSTKFIETFMHPMPAAQTLLLDGKGLLQSEVSTKEFDGNAAGSDGHSLKGTLISYPKTSTPDLNETAMSENTSSDFTTSNSDPSSRSSQQTSSGSKSSSSSDLTAAESSLDKGYPIQRTKPVISPDSSDSKQDNDSNDEALSVPDNNTIDNNSDVQKETDEDLLLGNGDEHPNAADEHIDSDIEMKLLKGNQADYEGGDEGINGSKECAQRRKVLKSPTIRNKACQMKPDSTADGNYRLPALSVLAQSILNGRDSLNCVDNDQKVDTLDQRNGDQCLLTYSFQITKSGDVKDIEKTNGTPKNDISTEPSKMKSRTSKRKRPDEETHVPTYSLPIRIFKPQDENPITRKKYTNLTDDPFFSGKLHLYVVKEYNETLILL